jgi:hypothetical protein
VINRSKVAKTTEQRLEIELMAAIAAIDTHEQFLQKLPLLNSLLKKTINVPIFTY